MELMSHSAALYCERDYNGHVSIEWLEGVVTLFKSYGLPIREYGIAKGPEDFGGPNRYRHSDPELYNLAQNGILRAVDLLCHSRKRRGLLMNWEGAATLNLLEGYAHVGLPARSGIGLSELLRQVYGLAKSVAPWRYGIGYSHPTGKAPCMYAVGVLGGPDYDPSESDEAQDRVAAWDHELHRAQRHLQGYFRDVYPANLLSAAHVNVRVTKTKTLLKAGWGEFTALDDGLWLWTVPEKDAPKARAALIRAKVLLCP